MTSQSPPEQERRAQIEAGLAATQARIEAACRASGRARADVTLVVVTKTHPVRDIRLLADLGVGDVGENRVQELSAKAAEGAYAGMRLHAIGRLQGNKAAEAARHAVMVHSFDRARLIGPLARGAAQAERDLVVLIQVSLDGDPARGGAPRAEVPALAEAVLASPLRLGGVMAVPPPAADPAAAFAELAEISADLRRLEPGAVLISAGMSADLEQAIAAGATHLRVGSAILGSRPPFG